MISLSGARYASRRRSLLTANAGRPRLDRYVLETDQPTVLDRWGFLDARFAARWPVRLS